MSIGADVTSIASAYSTYSRLKKIRDRINKKKDIILSDYEKNLHPQHLEILKSIDYQLKFMTLIHSDKKCPECNKNFRKAD